MIKKRFKSDILLLLLLFDPYLQPVTGAGFSRVGICQPTPIPIWPVPVTFPKHWIGLGEPEMIDPIPVQKTTQVPNRTLDIVPSITAQNAKAL